MSEVKDTQEQPKVEIAVENFGPIAEANIDLRPLTVFVGPSNTGKTYAISRFGLGSFYFSDFSRYTFGEKLLKDVGFSVVIFIACLCEIQGRVSC